MGISISYPKGYPVEDIYRKIDNSQVFAWSIFRVTTEPVRHTGLVLAFDGVKQFTINVRPKSRDILKATKCVVSCPATVRVEGVPQKNVKFFPYIQEIPLHVYGNRQRVKEMVAKWMAWRASYSLLGNNCRKSTINAVQMVCDENACHYPALSSVTKELDETQKKDGILTTLGFALVAAVALIGLMYDHLTRRDKCNPAITPLPAEANSRPYPVASSAGNSSTKFGGYPSAGSNGYSAENYQVVKWTSRASGVPNTIANNAFTTQSQTNTRGNYVSVINVTQAYN